MKLRLLAVTTAILFACLGCQQHSTDPKTPVMGPPMPPPDTPEHAIERFRLAYEQKKAAEYQNSFTGDFTYEFSSTTDPTLVQKYSTGWFKDDEKESSNHLFGGYTPPGGATLGPASSITINFSVTNPTDDNSAGINPATHKILATPVNGDITVPNPGAEATTYMIFNNFNVFYVVRGDAATGLDSTQPADANHWYVYRWVDTTGSPAQRARPNAGTQTTTWGSLKARFR